MDPLDFRNTTTLDDARILSIIREGVSVWSTGPLTLRVRYSRGADFSAACHYATRRILINIGRHVSYPYRLITHVAKAKTVGRYWRKVAYSLEFADGYQFVAFLFMHELYHLLVKRARRNTRQKESMCDRFAARFLVDRFGAVVYDPWDHPVARHTWDFQDLDGFVSAARKEPGTLTRAAQAAVVQTGL